MQVNLTQTSFFRVLPSFTGFYLVPHIVHLNQVKPGLHFSPNASLPGSDQIFSGFT